MDGTLSSKRTPRTTTSSMDASLPAGRTRRGRGDDRLPCSPSSPRPHAPQPAIPTVLRHYPSSRLPDSRRPHQPPLTPDRRGTSPSRVALRRPPSPCLVPDGRVRAADRSSSLPPSSRRPPATADDRRVDWAARPDPPKGMKQRTVRPPVTTPSPPRPHNRPPPPFPPAAAARDPLSPTPADPCRLRPPPLDPRDPPCDPLRPTRSPLPNLCATSEMLRCERHCASPHPPHPPQPPSLVLPLVNRCSITRLPSQSEPRSCSRTLPDPAAGSQAEEWAATPPYASSPPPGPRCRRETRRDAIPPTHPHRSSRHHASWRSARPPAFAAPRPRNRNDISWLGVGIVLGGLVYSRSRDAERRPSRP